MTTQRMGWAAATLVAVGVLAGCSVGVNTPATTPPQASASPATATTSSTAAAPSSATGSGGGAPAGGAQPASSGGSTSPTRCTAGELSVSLGQGDAGAGSVTRALVFTNTGSRTCELRGFPGVSYVAGDDGHQVGQAAQMAGERGADVPIAPRGTAVAQLKLANVQNFDPAVCMPTPVRGLRIYPPGETASLFVAMDGTGCAGTTPGQQLVVMTMTAG